MALATRLRETGGAALIIDYGHVRSDAGDTLQAIARHSFADPLQNAGEADVTAHVDFQALARAAEDVGACVHGPVTQGEFLQRLGIEARANSLMAKASEEVAEGIETAKARLIGGGRGGMGAMFKVLAISDPSLPMLVGFADEDSATGAAP
jgi:SAM-dependent MidA family methyltransferase